jgi:hypothetical protein
LNALLGDQSAEPFVRAVRALGNRVVWDWGFPPERIEGVRKLKQAGFQVWWFDADHAAARKAFIARGTVSVECLDIQMPKIVQAWPNIRDVFQPSIVETLGADGLRKSPEEIWRLMQERRSVVNGRGDR